MLVAGRLAKKQEEKGKFRGPQCGTLVSPNSPKPVFKKGDVVRTVHSMF